LIRQYFHTTNLRVLYAIAMGVFLLVVEIGFLLGRRMQSRNDDNSRSQTSTIQAALLAMLGLLLAFSFSMVLSHFDAREELIVNESLAIETTSLRSDLLPEPNRTAVASLLHRYVDAKIEFYSTGFNEDKIRQINETIEELQRQLWSQALAAGKVDQVTLRYNLFIQSLSDMFDFHGRGVAAMRRRIPDEVFNLLYFVAALGLGLTGYAAGLTGRRQRIQWLILSIAIASIIMLIVDMDRPRRTNIKVSQQSLVELRDRLPKTVP
jgi:hypothetical protein